MGPQEAQKPDIMHSIAATIVRCRFLIIVLFLVAAVY